MPRSRKTTFEAIATHGRLETRASTRSPFARDEFCETCGLAQNPGIVKPVEFAGHKISLILMKYQKTALFAAHGLGLTSSM